MKIKIQTKYKNKINKLKTTKLIYNNINKNIKLDNLNIPVRLLYKLNKTKGININTSKYLISKQGFTANTKNNYINKYKMLFIIGVHKYIKINGIIVGPLVKKLRTLHILKLKKNSSYRGLCHHLNLPVRGQRTCSNAKTRKKFKIY